jgi:vacuolar-type H+-ATPase catalytic subunit A/Vma1
MSKEIASGNVVGMPVAAREARVRAAMTLFAQEHTQHHWMLGSTAERLKEGDLQ